MLNLQQSILLLAINNITDLCYILTENPYQIESMEFLNDLAKNHWLWDYENPYQIESMEFLNDLTVTFAYVLNELPNSNQALRIRNYQSSKLD